MPSAADEPAGAELSETVAAVRAKQAETTEQSAKLQSPRATTDVNARTTVKKQGSSQADAASRPKITSAAATRGDPHKTNTKGQQHRRRRKSVISVERGGSDASQRRKEETDTSGSLGLKRRTSQLDSPASSTVAGASTSAGLLAFAMAFYELAVSLAVLAAAFAVSPQSRYWIKMTVYFVWLQFIALAIVPMALFKRGDPVHFSRGARMVNWLRGFFGVEFSLHGRENIRKEKAYIIVSNHQSSVDIIGMLRHWDAFEPAVPVIKGELRHALWFGWYCTLGGAVFVDRGSARGKSELADGLARAKRAGKSVWIFPEGTRNHTDSKLLPFKKGAFHMAIQSQMPILPVVFSDLSSFYSRAEQRFESGHASITVLPEISTEGLTIDDVGTLCDRTRHLMLQHIEKLERGTVLPSNNNEYSNLQDTTRLKAD